MTAFRGKFSEILTWTCLCLTGMKVMKCCWTGIDIFVVLRSDIQNYNTSVIVYTLVIN